MVIASRVLTLRNEDAEIEIPIRKSSHPSRRTTPGPAVTKSTGLKAHRTLERRAQILSKPSSSR
jgi:hypothetical protein